MDRKAVITNKIISVKQIIEVAEYLEKQRNHYTELIRNDMEKNETIPFNERRYRFSGNAPKNIEYNIKYIDNRKNQFEDLDSLKHELEKPQYISEIQMYFTVFYSDNYEDFNNYIRRNIFLSVNIADYGVSVSSSGDNLTSELQQLEIDIRNILEGNEDRMNGIVKKRFLVKLCFCLSIGFIVSYLLLLVLLLNKDAFEGVLEAILNNSFSFLLSQWFITFLFGCSFGLLIINSLYKNVAPKKKYSGYDRNIHMSVYKDDQNEFMNGNEIQIGVCANNPEKRSLLGQIYKVTKIIVLVQLVISTVLFIIMPK